MGKFKKLMEVSSNVGGYGADEGEPDTGFIRGDKKRVLGGLAGKGLFIILWIAGGLTT